MSMMIVGDDFVAGLIDFTEELGPRSPGWFRATCNRCDASTTGSEPNVEDWAYEHARRVHSRWKVYKRHEGPWAGQWIVQPPAADFDDSFAFASFRYALQYAADQATGAQR